MKIFLVGLMGLCSLTVSALAEPTPTPVPGFMQKMRPKDAKTRFFGEVKFPAPAHNRYFLHFYEFPQSSDSIASIQRNRQIDYIADLFERQLHNGKTSYYLVNRLKIARSYLKHDVQDFNAVKAQFLWLTPAKRQLPILRLTCIVEYAFTGDIESDIFFVFNKGVNNKPVIYDAYRFCDSSQCQSYNFDEIDKRGFRVLTKYLTSTDYEATNEFRWNGKGFYAVPTPTPTPLLPQ